MPDELVMPEGRRELLEAYLEHSPYCAMLGLRLEDAQPDRVVLRLPFSESLPTVGDVVHGGALSSLLDTAGVLAVWTLVDLGGGAPRGATVNLNVSFLAAARGGDVLADARVTRRGRQLSFCTIEAREAEGATVATGALTYVVLSG